MTKAYQRWLGQEITELSNSIKNLKQDHSQLKELKLNSIAILSRFPNHAAGEPSEALAGNIEEMTKHLIEAARISTQTIVINENESVLNIKLGAIANFAVNPEKENCYRLIEGKWKKLEGEQKSQLLLAYKKIKEHRLDSLSTFPLEVNP